MVRVIAEGVWMQNYVNPNHAHPSISFPQSGLVLIEDENNYGIDRRMFHPYSGHAPVHCAPPVNGRTYHSKKGYA